ncbi:MAG: hypothetical protein Q9188_000967 [Gyalolechia gomerana]
MTSSYRNQPIAPSTQKPWDYTDIPLIKKAIDQLNSEHKEYDVSRAALSIFTHYFPLGGNWAIVPEFRVEEGKRPDYLIEKFFPDPDDHDLPKNLFKPKIAVELKSESGESLMEALDQLTSSMPTLVDDMGNQDKSNFNIFLIIIKGKSLGFFEYHNDRSNLYEDGIQHHLGAIPFNLPQQTVPSGRPQYKGTGVVTYKDEYAKANEQLEDMSHAFLDLDKDAVRIQQVLLWMKEHEPLSGPI